MNYQSAHISLSICEHIDAIVEEPSDSTLLRILEAVFKEQSVCSPVTPAA